MSCAAMLPPGVTLTVAGGGALLASKVSLLQLLRPTAKSLEKSLCDLTPALFTYSRKEGPANKNTRARLSSCCLSADEASVNATVLK